MSPPVEEFWRHPKFEWLKKYRIFVVHFFWCFSKCACQASCHTRQIMPTSCTYVLLKLNHAFSTFESLKLHGKRFYWVLFIMSKTQGGKYDKISNTFCVPYIVKKKSWYRIHFVKKKSWRDIEYKVWSKTLLGFFGRVFVQCLCSKTRHWNF